MATRSRDIRSYFRSAAKSAEAGVRSSVALKRAASPVSSGERLLPALKRVDTAEAINGDAMQASQSALRKG